MRALIADDDRTASATLAGMLRRWDVDADVAHNGEEAWDRLRSGNPPSLALLDWMMPQLDGPILCQRIRQHPVLSRMYVILLTGRQARADLVAGLDAGADDYIVKPFDTDELRARVQVGLRVLRLQQRLGERVAALQSALSHVKHLSGLLPICCYCKRIRSDHDYWEQVESYIAAHSDARFSHGICPDCFTAVSSALDEDAGQES